MYWAVLKYFKNVNQIFTFYSYIRRNKNVIFNITVSECNVRA